MNFATARQKQEIFKLALEPLLA